MRPLSVLFLSLSLLLSSVLLIDSAKAGDYYGGGYNGGYNGGYYRSGYGHTVGYSRDCCFEKEVRHIRSVRYLRTYSGGYYDRPYRYSYSSGYNGGYANGYNGGYTNGYNGGNYGRPYYGASYNVPRYYAPSYTSGYVDSGYGSYGSCGARRVRVLDGRGGWVWSAQSTC
jgi:hypothetical protein